MADPRKFIKLHDGMPEHPKIVGLSDKAFRALVELWCYCSRNLTDGTVPRVIGNRVATPKSRRELIDAGLLVQRGDSYEMHDYLEHQMSAKEVRDLQERRREAGKKGGEAKAKRLASARGDATPGLKQTAGKNVAEKEKEKEKDIELPIGSSNNAREATYPDAFEEFWQAYPKKADKRAALRAWERALKRADREQILAGAVRYAADPNREDEFTKNAATWLNADAWLNPPEPPRGGRPPSRAESRIQSNLAAVEAVRRMTEGDTHDTRRDGEAAGLHWGAGRPAPHPGDNHRLAPGFG